MRVAFWSKRPLAFNRTHVPLARRIAYHLGLGVSRGKVGKRHAIRSTTTVRSGSTPACSEASTV